MVPRRGRYSTRAIGVLPMPNRGFSITVSWGYGQAQVSSVLLCAVDMMSANCSSCTTVKSSSVVYYLPNMTKKCADPRSHSHTPATREHHPHSVDGDDCGRSCHHGRGTSRNNYAKECCTVLYYAALLCRLYCTQPLFCNSVWFRALLSARVLKGRFRLLSSRRYWFRNISSGGAINL